MLRYKRWLNAAGVTHDYRKAVNLERREMDSAVSPLRLRKNLRADYILSMVPDSRSQYTYGIRWHLTW